MQRDQGTYLITGGTGSLGKALVKRLLKTDVKKVIVFSRGEYHQVNMARQYPGENRLRFFLGDVRDKDRLVRAFAGVDIVIHAAALKHVDKCNYNPFEAVQTNVLGSRNVISAAIDCDVKKVLNISSDKAVNPVNLYGATKLVTECLFSHASTYTTRTQFTSIRFGNFWGSSGSVVELYENLNRQGVKEWPITDRRMKRYWITFGRAAQRVFEVLRDMKSGEIYCPKMKELSIVDVAALINPNARLYEVGMRPGEKLREELLNLTEFDRIEELPDFYVIRK